MFDMNWNDLFQARGLLFTGMWVTLKITAVAVGCGLAGGVLLATMRVSGVRVLDWFAQAYVALFRSIPLVMLLLWFFLIVPQVLKALLDLSPSVDIRLVSAMVAFSLLEAAFFCEILRAGIESLPKGQFYAARALGMQPLQALRFIILPQAVKTTMPIILTQCIVIFQDTSLVYVIALGDFFRRATSIGERDGTLIQMLLFAGVVYWIICSSMTTLVYLVQRRLARS
jgi:glutamate/aspartate transport system permease protein